MRLFAYYALHTFKNQLKKLFKTWVLIFLLVCFAVGIGVGVIAAALDGSDDASEPPTEDELTEGGSFLEGTGVTESRFIELLAGGAVFLVFFFCAFNADKNGSRIFQPADVNLLFPSPMKPQSVLMFRLATQVGVGIVGSIYMLFQVPNLTLNMGLDVWAALALVLAWGLAVAFGALLQLMLYTLSATYPTVKRNLRRCLYGLLAVVAGAFAIYAARSGQELFPASVSFFCAKFTRYIPFWGWLKGFCAFAAEGNGIGAALSLLALLLGGGVLVYLIWHVKADFYEDAMAKSEETAELLAAVQSDKSAGVTVRRKKDRSEKLRRDGMERGWGANVFFFKTMYNRRRFARFGIFTKTMETYLVAAAAVAAVCRFTGGAGGGSAMPVALVLGALAFFRSLGNPLERDTVMDCFLLIPESTWAKLFWSLMGGTADCLLDVLPAMVVGALLMGANPLAALLWVPLIVSVDFYATTVGAFIGLSVPVSAGKTIKQVVQIMFVYFGLLPDALIAVLGIVSGYTTAALMIAAVLNFGLGFVFFGLAPIFIDPKGGSRRIENTEFEGDMNMAKRQFSRLGMGLTVIFLSASVFQVIAAVIVTLVIWPGGDVPGWVSWLVTFVPMYLIGVPLGLLVIRRAPAAPRERRTVGAGRLITLGFICVFVMYAGNILGNIILMALQSVLGRTAVNPILGYAMDENIWLRALVMVVLAPMIEEFVFRKQLIDRMNVYGEKLAVLTSALLFGLFHGNLSQCFYAFALGLVFGYVYLRTGRLRYSTALHMFINFLGSVVAPAVLNSIDLEALSAIDVTDVEALTQAAVSLLPLMAYGLVMLVLTVAGLVLFCVNTRKTVWEPAPLELPKKGRFKTVWLNAGMLLFAAICLASIAATFFQ